MEVDILEIVTVGIKSTFFFRLFFLQDYEIKRNSYNKKYRSETCMKQI